MDISFKIIGVNFFSYDFESLKSLNGFQKIIFYCLVPKLYFDEPQTQPSTQSTRCSFTFL